MKIGVRSPTTRTPIFPIEIFHWCLWGTVIIRNAIAEDETCTIAIAAMRLHNQYAL